MVYYVRLSVSDLGFEGDLDVDETEWIKMTVVILRLHPGVSLNLHKLRVFELKVIFYWIFVSHKMKLKQNSILKIGAHNNRGLIVIKG